MKVLLLDAMNLVHRARCGFAKGEHAIVFSFFRSLKPIVEKLKPQYVYFVLEGKPKHRKEFFVEYKANRKSQPDSFWRQKDEILKILSFMPITVIKHPDYECDDIIANLAKYHSEKNDNVTIVSTDTDFIQVWDVVDKQNVSIYHPIKKKYVEKPDYSYLEWKALRGDPSDNILGVPGVGDITATKIMNDPELKKKIFADDVKKQIFERNKCLIKFHWFDELSNLLESQGCITENQKVSLESVKQEFANFGFSSMLKDSYWGKFENTFNKLLYKNI